MAEVWKYFAHEDDYPDLDEAACVERMAGLLRFRTVSHLDPTLTDWDEFDRLQAYMRETWPHVFAAAQVERIDHSLLLTLVPDEAVPTLDPVLLMGHMDVVPVVEGTESDWTYDAYSGHVDDTFVWGRGSVDMKDQVAGEFEAAEYALAHGWRLRRPLILAFGQDEEDLQSGAKGISRTLQERGVHLAFVVDEGTYLVEDAAGYGAPGVPIMGVGLAEKGYADIELTAHSVGGHSSTPFPGTSLGFLAEAITRIVKAPWPVALTPLDQATFAAVSDRVTDSRLTPLVAGGTQIPADQAAARSMTASQSPDQPTSTQPAVAQLPDQPTSTQQAAVQLPARPTPTQPSAQQAAVQLPVQPTPTQPSAQLAVDQLPLQPTPAQTIAAHANEIAQVCLADPALNAFVTTTVAPTVIEGSSQANNVLPQDMRAVINFRILEGLSVHDVLARCQALVAGESPSTGIDDVTSTSSSDDSLSSDSLTVSGALDPLTTSGQLDPLPVEVRLLGGDNEPSAVSRADGEGFAALKRVAARYFRDPATGEPVRLVPELQTGATDARSYEPICDSCLRISAFVVDADECARGVHGTDERITRRAYLQGVRFMISLLAESVCDPTSICP